MTSRGGGFSVFENLALGFSKNRADGDDVLGDAYEYLMRHFAWRYHTVRAMIAWPPRAASAVRRWP